jgi:hypothetical protein
MFILENKTKKYQQKNYVVRNQHFFGHRHETLFNKYFLLVFEVKHGILLLWCRIEQNTLFILENKTKIDQQKNYVVRNQHFFGHRHKI